MSLWFRTKDNQGRVHYVAVEGPLIVLPFALGILVGVILPALAAAPLQVFMVFASLLAAGFVCFAVAKLSVILRGWRVSFGSRRMTPGMRRLYRTGYTLMAAGAASALFCARAIT